MKKLVFLLVTVVMTAISANIFAQNTGILPTVGTTHAYYVNSTDGSSQDLGDVNNTFIWWVSTNQADLTDQETPGTDFNVISGTYGGSGGVNNYIIELEWLPVSAEDTFYVVVQEFDTDGNQCSNTKAIAVVPQNDFEVQFVALGADGISIGDSLSRCAPDVALTASGLNITYDYGVDTVQFKLAATGIYTSWSFTGTFANVLGSTLANIEYQIGSNGWTSTPPATVPANAAGTEDVYIRVALDNGDTAGTYEEGTAEQTVKLTLSGVQDSGSNSAVIVNAADNDITADPVQLHTIQARPATTGIGYN